MTAIRFPERRPARLFVSLAALVWPLVVSCPASYAQARADLRAFSRPSFADAVTDAARRFGMPASWLFALIEAESGGDPHAISRAGALGLMQLMPETWAVERARLGLGGDPFEPRDNILAGADYLRTMRKRYGPVGMLAAYNAGPGRYEAYRRTGRPLPTETVAYVRRLAPIMTGEPDIGDPLVARPDARSWTHAPLFAASSARSAPRIPMARGASPPGKADRARRVANPSERADTTGSRSALYPQRGSLFAALGSTSS